MKSIDKPRLCIVEYLQSKDLKKRGDIDEREREKESPGDNRDDNAVGYGKVSISKCISENFTYATAGRRKSRKSESQLMKENGTNTTT